MKEGEANRRIEIQSLNDKILVLDSLAAANVRVSLSSRGNWRAHPARAAGDGSSASAVRGGFMTQRIFQEKELAASIDARAISEVNAGIKHTKAGHDMRDAGLESARAYNLLSGNLLAAGMAMTMFGKSERMQRAGMLLNLAAMSIQIVKTGQASMAMLLKNKQDATNVVITAQATAGTTAWGTAQNYLAASATRAGAAMLTLYKRAAPLLLFAAASYAIVTVFEKLGWLSLDAAAGIDEMNSSLVDTAQVMEILADEAMSLDAINDLLVIKNDLLTIAENSTTSLAQVTAESLRAEIAGLMQARDVKHYIAIGADWEESGEAVQDYFDLIKKEEEHIAKFGGTGHVTDPQALVNRTIQNTDLTLGLFGDKPFTWEMLEDIRSDITAFETDYATLWAYIDEHKITNVDDLRDSIQMFGDEITTWSEREQNALADMVGGYGVAEQALDSFNNKREELFFGFSSQNLTGDLIRQVHQQGVETLITTTEVIMTNNFNGMTLPEMADQIIEEIESRGHKFTFA